MKNEYGARLDRNGYAPSIIPEHNEFMCWRCGCNAVMNRHEIFHSHYGANREKSKRLGLWVNVCRECHADIHASVNYDRLLKEIAQQCAERKYGWTKADFIREFGKNYLEEDENA